MISKKTKSKIKKILTRGSTNPLVSWIETVIIAVISSALWLQSVQVYQLDPSLNVGFNVVDKQQFFWPLIFVMAVALRYGFTLGFSCALLTIVFTISYFRYFELLIGFSYYKAVGLLIVSMICGEFRDAWDERLHRNDLDMKFMQRKLDLFTQNYFLLRASHDQLEQRMAGQVVSLRSSVTELEKISERYPIVGSNLNKRLSDMSSAVISLFAQIIGIEIAAFYAIENNKINSKPLAQIGNMENLDLADPMLKDMMATQNLLSPIDMNEHAQNSKYQLCIPIKDTADNLLACVIVSQLKFFTLTQQNLAILNLVVNYAADILSNDVIAPVIKTDEKKLFLKYLGFALNENIKRKAQSSIIFCKGKTRECMQIFDKTIASRRGADIYWMRKDLDGNYNLIVLLPLTSLVQAQMFCNRIKSQFEQNNISNNEIEFTEPMDVNLDDDKLKVQLQKLGVSDADISNFAMSN